MLTPICTLYWQYFSVFLFIYLRAHICVVRFFKLKLNMSNFELGKSFKHPVPWVRLDCHEQAFNPC